MQVRLAAVLAQAASGERLNVSAVCRELGISRKHYYVLRARFDAGGVEAVIHPRSRRPVTSPRQLPAAVEDEVVRRRKQLVEDGLDCGARSIRDRMRRDGVDPVPAVSTIHRALRRRGLVVDEPAKRPRSADRRFEFPDPNGCWQLDGTQWPLTDGTVAVILKVIDDHSRAIMAMRAAPSENTEDAWAVVLAAIDRHGPPARMLTDRGAALNGHPQRQSVFRTRLRRLGIHPISSRGYHPQTCGKTERSHQTLQRWLARRPAGSLPELQQLLEQFTALFNTDRPHQALDGDTPHERYTARPKAAPLGSDRHDHGVVTHVRVSARGEIRAGRYTIQVGRTWQAARVTVLRDDLNVVVMHDHEIIRRLVLDPDRRYQPNGRPRPQSPKPHARQVLPMS